VDAEIERLTTAVNLSDQQLQEIKNRLGKDGQDHALILEAHRLMLHDPMLLDDVHKLIRTDFINAEWAVRRTARKIKHLFDEIPDEYFRERLADVDFVADRIVRNLLGQQVVDVEESPQGR
jgi:phosphotransferase system enzyme I (PtsI)